MAMIKDRISHLQENISLICQKLGRNPQDIILVGVTKFAEPDQINEAIDCGLKDIGENKVQEAQKKFSSLHRADSVRRHMIGHLQTNKVKSALDVFNIIESVDSIKLAREISKQAEKLNRSIDILVQINTSGEEQKHGISASEAMWSIEEIGRLGRINILGLMTIAPLTEDKEKVRECFRSLKKIFDGAAETFKGTKINMKYLSMGMTNDYEIAIEEGANMVRIGRAIFADE